MNTFETVCRKTLTSKTFNDLKRWVQIIRCEGTWRHCKNHKQLLTKRVKIQYWPDSNKLIVRGYHQSEVLELYFKLCILSSGYLCLQDEIFDIASNPGYLGAYKRIYAMSREDQELIARKIAAKQKPIPPDHKLHYLRILHALHVEIMERNFRKLIKAESRRSATR
jgi:hypothetical protein